MKTETHQNAPTAHTPPYPPMALEPRTHVTSERAAFMPGRRPQTTTTAPQQFTPPFPPLALVDKPNLTTAETAYYLNRRPQTLRGWACLENFPDGLRCKRIGGLLAWPTVEVKALTGAAA